MKIQAKKPIDPDTGAVHDVLDMAASQAVVPAKGETTVHANPDTTLTMLACPGPVQKRSDANNESDPTEAILARYGHHLWSNVLANCLIGLLL